MQNNTMLLAIFLPILVSLLLVGGSINSLGIVYAQVGQNYTTYTNPELGITFEYPSDWKVKEKTDRFAQSPEVQVYDGLNEFKYLGSEGGMDDTIDAFGIDWFAETLMSAVLADTADGSDNRLIENVEISDRQIDGKEAATFLYVKEPLFGKEYAIQVFVVNNDGNVDTMAYQNIPEDFDSSESQETMNKILDSFTFSGSSNEESNNLEEDEDN